MLFPSAKSKGHYTSNSLLTHLFHLTFQKSYPMLNICKQWNKEKGLDMDDFHESMQVSSGGAGRGIRPSEKNPSERQKGGALPKVLLAGSGIGTEALEDAWMGGLVTSLQQTDVFCCPKRRAFCCISNPRTRDLEIQILDLLEIYTNSDESLL